MKINYLTPAKSTKRSEFLISIGKSLKHCQNSRIAIMKQNKGRGVVLMDRTVYLDKCLDILDTNQFTKLSTDTTKKMEEKNRLFLRKIKRSLSAQEYSPYIPQDHIRINSMEI